MRYLELEGFSVAVRELGSAATHPASCSDSSAINMLVGMLDANYTLVDFLNEYSLGLSDWLFVVLTNGRLDEGLGGSTNADILIIQDMNEIAQIDQLVSRILTAMDRHGTSPKDYDPTFKRRAYTETLAIYSNPTFIKAYFERWKTNIPIEKINQFLSFVGNCGVILDAGCGPGHHSNMMNQLGYSVVGIDFSLEAIKLARSVLSCSQFCVCDMRLTGFRDVTFSGIWACASVVHLPSEDFPGQLSEFRRILIPNGILAVTLSIGKRSHRSPDGRFFESYRTESEVKQLFLNCGLHPVVSSTELTGSTTSGGATYAKWTTIMARKI